jgi:hypothetical protein
MLKSFAVRNFRCLADFEIHNLARINLLVGDNGAGKTALLDAFFAHMSQGNAINFLKLKAFRRSVTVLPDEGFWQEFFTDLDASREILLSSLDSDGKERTSKVSVGPPTQVVFAVPPAASGAIEPSPARFTQAGEFRPLRLQYSESTSPQSLPNEVTLDPSVPGLVQKFPAKVDHPAHYFSAAGLPEPEEIAKHVSALIVAKEEAPLVSLAKAFDDRVRALSVASPKGPAEVFVDLGERYLLPLTLMGSGPLRTIGVASVIPSYKSGALLVDEVETGIYYKRLAELWKGLCELAKRYNVQVIATTHSAECVSAAIEAVTPDLQDADPLHVYRIVRGQRSPIPYEKDSLRSALEFAAELR